MTKQHGLGKGLDALFNTQEKQAQTPEQGVQEIRLADIDPNPNQPRKAFDMEALAQLAESIRQYGVIQPVTVEAAEGRYRLIAGERRWRAARLAELATIPVIVRTVDAQQQMEISLIENLQREDLNPIEEAQALQAIMDSGEYTQEELAQRMGRSRPAVANVLRLLQLPVEILQMLQEQKLSEGHGRALLGAPEEERIALAEKAIAQEWSVRQLEAAAQQSRSEAKASPKTAHAELSWQAWEDAVGQRLGTKVRIQGTQDKGRMTIEYYQRADLERVLEVLGVSADE